MQAEFFAKDVPELNEEMFKYRFGEIFISIIPEEEAEEFALRHTGSERAIKLC